MKWNPKIFGSLELWSVMSNVRTYLFILGKSLAVDSGDICKDFPELKEVGDVTSKDTLVFPAGAKAVEPRLAVGPVFAFFPKMGVPLDTVPETAPWF